MKQLALDIGLSTRPTLDTYFTGPNEEALAHLRLWTSGACRSPVPPYLWGGNGCGKTQLLQAVHLSLTEQGLNVGWLDSHSTHPPPFDDHWAAVLMDDVHLYDAEQQHTAFNWFVNALTPRLGAPRWVLAAGHKPPADLRLREDLRSRLGWGHVYALQSLGEHEQRSVLRQAADARGLFLSDDLMRYMLNRFSRDLGSLMQLLDHLDHYALQTRRALTIPLVRAMLDNE